MVPLRYICLLLIVKIARYTFWVIFMSSFVVLFRVIIDSVYEYHSSIKKYKNQKKNIKYR